MKNGPVQQAGLEVIEEREILGFRDLNIACRIVQHQDPIKFVLDF